MVDKIEYTNNLGTLLHYKELPYPQKGFPYPEVVWVMNCSKKVILGKIKFLAKSAPILFPFLFLPRKHKVKFIENLLDSILFPVDYMFDEFYIEPNLYCPSAKESAEWAYLFLTNLGINKETAGKMAQVVAMIMEYDNAYRYRVQDVVGETTRELLIENPRREVLKLVNTMVEREPSWINNAKFNAIGKIFSLILLIPSINRAFKSSIPNIELIKQDEADKYHCLFRSDYNYQGLPFEKRWEMLRAIHGGEVPIPVQVGLQKVSAPVDVTPAETQSQI
jgi:hypothetical protein